jgi:hypothetical protein
MDSSVLPFGDRAKRLMFLRFSKGNVVHLWLQQEQDNF